MNVTALGRVDLSNQISVAVARKGLDAAERQGAAMVQLLRDAAEVGAGSRGAISATASAGETGRLLDVTA